MNGFLGQSSGHIDSTRMARFAVRYVSVAPAIKPRLRICLQCSFMSFASQELEIDAYRLIELPAELQLLDTRTHVADIIWSQRSYHPIRCGRGEADGQDLDLTCPFDFQTLEAVEKERNGGDLKLQLALWPVIGNANDFWNVRVEPLKFIVPQNDWLNVLDKLEHTQHDIVELRWPTNSELSFKDALMHLRASRHMVDEGHYKGAVENCRHAITAFFEQLPSEDKEERLTRYLQARLPDSRTDLHIRIFSSAKKIVDGAHHHPHNWRFEREEALFVIRTFENFFSLVATTLDQ